MIFGGNLALPNMIDAYKRMTQSATDSVDLTITSRAGMPFAPADSLRLLAEVGDVQATTGVLQRQMVLPDGTLPGTVQVEIVGVDPATIAAVRQFRLADGRLLQSGDQHALVLPANAAASGPRPAAGSKLALPSAEGVQEYTVVGVLEDGAIGAPRLFVPLADAQAIFAQPGLINAIELAIRPGADQQAVIASAQRVLGDDYVVGPEGNATDNGRVAARNALEPDWRYGPDRRRVDPACKQLRNRSSRRSTLSDRPVCGCSRPGGTGCTPV